MIANEDLARAIAVFAELQDEHERAAWAPRERVPASVWAANRDMSLRASPSAPGEFKWLAPWMPGLCDLLCDPRVNWLVILKAAQIGVSELVRTAIGWSADLDPKPVLWVMTTQVAAESAVEKLGWMFEDTECLASLISGEVTLEGFELTNGMKIGIAWAGSPQAMASDPWCWIVLDEVAKYRQSVGGEGTITKNAGQRTKAFGLRGKAVLLSSPKHETDNICTEHAATLDKRRFYVPCPSCESLQPLDWDWVRWTGGEPSTAPIEPNVRLRLAAKVQAEQSAWIACRYCDARINSLAAMKAPTATWVRELEDGTFEVRPEPCGEPIGVQISELYHWKTTTSDLVAKFLRCLTPSDLQDFWNGCLGLPYKNERGAISAAAFRRKTPHKDLVVPPWSVSIASTVDTQADCFWLNVRAHGKGRKSRLIYWAKVATFAELEALGLEQRFRIDGHEGLVDRPRLMLIDSGGGMATPDGSRTHDVYQFARNTPNVYAIKGEGGEPFQGMPIRRRTVIYAPPGGRHEGYEQELLLLNVEYWKDTLSALIRSENGHWELCESAVASDEYARQLASEHKVMVPTSSGESRWRWVVRTRGAANHLWDTEVYQCAAAELLEVENPSYPTVAEEASALSRVESVEQERQIEVPDWIDPNIGQDW